MHIVTIGAVAMLFLTRLQPPRKTYEGATHGSAAGIATSAREFGRSASRSRGSSGFRGSPTDVGVSARYSRVGWIFFLPMHEFRMSLPWM
jgi:hypothetical protein